MSPVIVPRLPSELHLEILSRISKPESLLRFRCVCKEWRSLIDDPVFAKSHYYDTLLIQNPSTRQVYTIPLGYLDYISETTEIEAKKVHQVIDADQLGLPELSCHGLILIAANCIWTVEQDWLLWNPYKDGQLGVLTLIPPYNGFRPTENGEKYHTTYVGLGYDSATDDYKVVRIAGLGITGLAIGGRAGSNPLVRIDEVSKTAIYSVRSGEWRRINNDFPRHFRAIYPVGGVFLNGALHWITGDSKEQGQGSNVVGWIVALDLTTETYRKLPLPLDKKICYFFTLRLYAVGGYLFLTHRYEEYLNTMWILKDYGGENRWSQLINFNYSLNMRPIAYIKSKEQVIICSRPDELIWFHVKNKRLLKRITFPPGGIQRYSFNVLPLPPSGLAGIRHNSFNFQVLPTSLNWLDGIGSSDDGGMQEETKKTNDTLKLNLRVERRDINDGGDDASSGIIINYEDLRDEPAREKKVRKR